MNRPNIEYPKSPWGHDSLRILDYVDSIKPLSGIGTTVFDAPGGRVINAAPALGGYGGAALHNVAGLAGKVPDAIKIVGQVVEEIIGGVEIPDPWEFITELSEAFVNVLYGEDVPEIEQVEEWVDGLLEGTLDDLVGDIPAAITDVLGGLFDGVPDILSSYFGGPSGPWPKGGDYIFSPGPGICYMVFPATGIPVTPSIFQVPFTVGTGDQAQPWVAMTLIPTPDISAMVTSATSLLTTALNAVLEIASNLLVASIMSVFEIAKAVRPLILQLIEEALAAVWATIASLIASLEELTERVTVIEGLLENITEIPLLDADGICQNVTVLNVGDSTDTRELVYWIDSNTGAGQVGKMLRWEPDTHLGDVDWRYFYWLAQDGRRWGAKLLSLNTDGYPKLEDAPTGGTAGGAVIGSLFGRITTRTCDEGLIDVLKAETAE